MIWPRHVGLVKFVSGPRLGIGKVCGSVGLLVAELRGTVGIAVDGGSAAVQVKSAISGIMATVQPIHRGKARI